MFKKCINLCKRVKGAQKDHTLEALKKTKMERKLKILIVGWTFLGMLIGVLIGFEAGMIVESKKAGQHFKQQLKECQYAPTPITIGDSVYIVRYYPMNY